MMKNFGISIPRRYEKTKNRLPKWYLDGKI